MWIHKRLDISWGQLIKIIFSLNSSGNRDEISKEISRTWSAEDENFVCLSVRTGFDLLLRTLNFPAGSEIISSAVTIPDMFKIMNKNNFKIVPIDINIENLQIDYDKISEKINDNTRIIIVVNIFGVKHDINRIKEIIGERKIIIIEDCAQLFTQTKEERPKLSDISMYSFGTIKSATAFGGGILNFKDIELCKKLKEEHSKYPVQETSVFRKKVFKLTLLKMLSGSFAFALIFRLFKIFGSDIDQYLYKSTRGFQGDMFKKIAHQPTIKLLKALNYRLKTYNYDIVKTNIEHGKKMTEILSDKFLIPGYKSEYYSYWVFPVASLKLKEVFKNFRKDGYFLSDKHGITSYNLFTGEDHNLKNADRLMNEVVYLPFYPEKPLSKKLDLSKKLLDI